MADQHQEAGQCADIISVLAEMNRGRFVIECGRQLAEATSAITRTGKKAKLTITLDIIPAGMRDGRINQFEILPGVTLREPQESQGSSIFFISDDNRLTRNDPDQIEIEFDAKEKQENAERR